MNPKTLSVHVKRDKAREREREIQMALDTIVAGRGGSLEKIRADEVLKKYSVPEWAKGVKTAPVVGGLLHLVQATENRGH
jgi:hypothetical protein